MPGPRVVPRVAAGLLIAAFAAAPAATSIAHAAEAPHVAVTAQVAPAHAATTHNSHGPHTPGAPKIWKTHTVRPGDYLWEIAEHYYGDGAQYHKIAEASGIDAHSDLAVGQKLVIPGPLRHDATPPHHSASTHAKAATPAHTPTRRPAPAHKATPAPTPATPTTPTHTV
ncbi:LysM peptidoglycan-binding domain-containing protein, partial [Cutibacterium acnes]